MRQRAGSLCECLFVRVGFSAHAKRRPRSRSSSSSPALSPASAEADSGQANVQPSRHRQPRRLARSDSYKVSQTAMAALSCTASHTAAATPPRTQRHGLITVADRAGRRPPPSTPIQHHHPTPIDLTNSTALTNSTRPSRPPGFQGPFKPDDRPRLYSQACTGSVPDSNKSARSAAAAPHRG